jgi:tyrosyl-tRNA synthetase
MGDNEKILGMTSPLLTKSDGSKFSKSEGGAIWLDKEKTSPYELYQFFLNSTDADVINYLKTLTLLDRNVIEKLEESVKNEPEKRFAQRTLAYEIVRFVHGEEEAENAKKTSEEIFNNRGISDDMPTITLNKDEINHMNVLDFLVTSKIVESKSEARRLIEQGGISINQEKVTDVNMIIELKEEIILQKGKKTYLKVKIN